MGNTQQLVKKSQEGYDKVFPKTFLDAIKDRETGMSLTDILSGFNNYFLSYSEDKSTTRLQVPPTLRREGLWITYVDDYRNVITEWYNNNSIDDKSWSDSSNWRIASNYLVGNISISDNGKWVINNKETEFNAVGEKGVTPLLRMGPNNKIQVSYNKGKSWEDISDYVVPKFRWVQGSGTTAGKIQISMDLGSTWTDLSNNIINNLRISRYIGPNESLPTSGIAEGTIYMKGPIYDENDALNENPIYRMWVYAWKDNTLAWQDNGEFTSIAAGIVQETGDSENAVMSQKVVTDKLSELGGEVIETTLGLNIKRQATITYGAYNRNTGFIANEQPDYYPATNAVPLINGIGRSLYSEDADYYLFYTEPPINSQQNPPGFILSNREGWVPDNAKFVIFGYPLNYTKNRGDVIKYEYRNNINSRLSKVEEEIPTIQQEIEQTIYPQILKRKVTIGYGAYNVNTGLLFGEQAVKYPASNGIEINEATKFKITTEHANVYLFYSDIPNSDGSNYIGWNTTGNVMSGAKYVILGLLNTSPLNKGDIIEYYNNIDVYGRLLFLEDEVNTATIKKLVGKTVWTLWDSLGHDTWQSKFVNLSGCNYYANLNTKIDKPLSWGGSNSEPSNDSGTQARALNLVSYKDTYPIDIILIENINDRNILNGKGSINDTPFMRTQVITYSDVVFNSYEEANNYLNSNKLSVVSSIPVEKRKRGTIIKIPYTSGSEIRGSKIKFNSTPTSEGDITLTWAGRAYSIHVTPSMSIQDIVNSVIQYSFGSGVSDIDNGDGSVSIFYYTTTSNRVTFDDGGTGVSATITDTTGSGTISLLFNSDNVDDWSNIDKWVKGCSLYSIYKGLIEYLKSNLPTAIIYFVTPFSVGVDFNSNEYKYADGTWSTDKFKQSSTYIKQKELYDVQKEVAEYYGVQVLDLVANGGMDITNIETFFHSNNVHPKSIGYDRYAETIYKLIE